MVNIKDYLAPIKKKLQEYDLNGTYLVEVNCSFHNEIPTHWLVRIMEVEDDVQKVIQSSNELVKKCLELHPIEDDVFVIVNVYMNYKLGTYSDLLDYGLLRYSREPLKRYPFVIRE